MSNREEQTDVSPPTPPSPAEWMAKQQADYFWFLSQPDVCARYPGRVLATHGRAILGSGRDNLEALEDARARTADRQQTLPEPWEVLFVVVPEAVEFPPGFYPTARELRAQNGALPL